ncbi:MAG: CopG family antitoxin [Candidatus Omnitrophota bacterium]
MKRVKTSISNAGSYQEIGEFWDEHDLIDFWDKTKPAEFDVDIQFEKRYYPLDRDIASEVTKIAQIRGIAVETLLNLWIKEKITEQKI